jgi:hypothetical protein
LVENKRWRKEVDKKDSEQFSASENEFSNKDSEEIRHFSTMTFGDPSTNRPAADSYNISGEDQSKSYNKYYDYYYKYYTDKYGVINPPGPNVDAPPPGTTNNSEKVCSATSKVIPKDVSAVTKDSKSSLGQNSDIKASRFLVAYSGSEDEGDE